MGTAQLLRLLTLFLGILVLQETEGWSITVPKHVNAVEGSCVVVPCQTEAHFRVAWYQYHIIHFPVVYDELLPNSVAQQFKGRTSVPGDASKGNCTLMIKNVKRGDDKLQVYVWINPDAKPTQKFHDQLVTISVERKAPRVSIQKQIVEGEAFQANCSIRYSCPFSPPPLQWNKSPVMENSTLTALNEKVQGQWLYTETLRTLATYHMHNSKMWCSAQFRSLVTESHQITLNILYKPVSVTLILENELVIESGSVIMECAADSNPPPQKFSWLKRRLGQDTKINSSDGKMTFNNIMRHTSVSCMAHNAIGAGQSSWLDLDVQYAPVILPESSCHLTGEVLQCVCQADASPTASIYWTIDGNDTLPSSFSFVSANSVPSGGIRGPAGSQFNISCTATNSLGSDTKQLSKDNFSKTSSLPATLAALIILGTALLLGCVMFIYRKYYRDRPPGYICNIHLHHRPQSVLDNVQQDQRSNSHQRSNGGGTQCNTFRPESNSEEDGPTCVYENYALEEIYRPATTQQRRNDRRVV